MIEPLKVTRITALIHCPGQDEVTFNIDAPSAHPNMDALEPGKYPSYVTLKLQKGYAKEWLVLMGVDLSKVKVISMLHGELPEFPEDLTTTSKIRGQHT